MPRSIWNGTITFALVAVPIKVHSAIEDRTVHFHQVHAEDGARITQKRMCTKEGKEVPYGEVAKGFEVRGGEYVLLDQDEIDAAAGEQAHRIELDEFVSQTEIDPVFYDRTYYLGTREEGEAAYRLLHDALSRSGRAGIGRWVFHNREYLVAVRSLDGVLALHTVRYADELVRANSLDVPRPSRKPTKREVEMAGALVESLHSEFKPTAFRDTYRKRVLELIDKKAKGQKIELPEPEQPEESEDLAAALEASMKGRSAKRTKSRSGGGSRSGSASKSRSRTRS